MNNKIPSLIFFILMWPIVIINGQSAFHFAQPNLTQVKLTFRMSQNLIVIPVSINQSNAIRLVLDSGISSTIISSLIEPGTIQVRSARKIQIAGLGSGKTIDAYYSKGNQVRLSNERDTSRNITHSNLDVYILANDQFNLSHQLGLPVNGLLGSTIFKDFIIKVSPVQKEITFFNREAFSFKRRTRGFEKIPVMVIDGKAYMDVGMVQEDRSVIVVRLLIDTGASLSFWISPQADSGIKIPSKTVRTFLGQGMGGPISGVNGRVNQAVIGPFVFNRALVSYPDSSSIVGITLNSMRHGSIGNDIFRRFDVYYDYAGSAIYLKPNKWFRSPFSYNRSGMEVEKINPEVSFYAISTVVTGSPAGLCGLKEGDILEYINNQPAFHLSLDEINNILYGDNGSRVSLQVDRNGEKIRVRFRLDPKI